MSDSEKDSSAQKETVFYYNRERRLKNASPAVQALNNDQYGSLTLRKILLGNRGNLMLLVGIVVISIFGLVINFINREPSPASSITLGGNNLALAIFRVDAVLILSITKNAPESGEVFIGEVDIAVSPAQIGEGEEPQIFSHRVFFRPAASEIFHVSLPFDGNDFFTVLRAGEEQRSIRLRTMETE